MESSTSGKILAMIAIATVVIIALLFCIYLVALVARPVLEELSHTLSMINIGSFGRGRGGSEIHSLAVLCIILIFLVGLAKVLTRKK